jgi:hypothetical protein
MSMMSMEMKVHAQTVFQDTKSRTLKAMSAGDCSLAPPSMWRER